MLPVKIILRNFINFFFSAINPIPSFFLRWALSTSSEYIKTRNPSFILTTTKSFRCHQPIEILIKKSLKGILWWILSCSFQVPEALKASFLSAKKRKTATISSISLSYKMVSVFWTNRDTWILLCCIYCLQLQENHKVAKISCRNWSVFWELTSTLWKIL